MAANPEDGPLNVWASASEGESAPEDESEDEMRQNLEFNFGEIELQDDKAKGTITQNS